MQIFRKHPDFFFCLLLSLLVLGFTVPFLNHAYHIDEPLFLRVARQIKEHPLDPYGFWYLWNNKYERMDEIAAFPPVFSYFLAAVGWAYRFPPEWLIHLSIVPFALIAVLSFYALTRQFGLSSGEGLMAAGLMAVSPAFVLSANLAMPDVAATSLGILSVTLAICGWTKNRLGYLLASGVALGVASLMRYNAFPLVLIIFLLGLTFTEIKKAILPSFLTIGMVVLWMAISRFITGEAHTTEVLSIFAKTSGWMSRFWSLNIHLTLTTFLPFLALLLWWRKGAYWIFLVIFIAIDFGIYAAEGIKRFAFFPDTLFFALGIATLLFLFITFIKDIRGTNLVKLSTSKEGEEFQIRFSTKNLSALRNNLNFRYATLFIWILSILFIPLIYVHFASKYLLLAQPPLILVIFYLLKNNFFSPQRLSMFLIPVVLVFSLLIARADFTYANVYREEAEWVTKFNTQPDLLKHNSPIPFVWFTGHWGWQYYLEKGGAIPLPYNFPTDARPIAGDIIVTSKYASALDIHPALLENLVRLETHEKEMSLPLRTMNPIARTGFYSNHWGPLPYNLSLTPVEEFKIYQVMPETKKESSL
jgi:4-amino-4-deoxy-L-arabinose transferase-like glycosyltransferase